MTTTETSTRKCRYWTPATGLQPQQGTVIGLHTFMDIQIAQIAPDANPTQRIYLCERAVWGFEYIAEPGAQEG